MRIPFTELLAFVVYLLRLTKLKCTHMFVYFRGAEFRKNHVFHRDVLLLWNLFAVLIFKTTPLEEKNLFVLLRVYQLVMFKQVS